MPTYNYLCKSCLSEHKVFQQNTKNLRKCPKCGALTLKRQIGAGSSALFKGTGFYCTDYRKSQPVSPTKPSSATSVSA